MTCGHPECFAKWLPGKRMIFDKQEARSLHQQEEVLSDG